MATRYSLSSARLGDVLQAVGAGVGMATNVAQAQAGEAWEGAA